MKKRLRKKKKLGEFVEYGFEVRILFEPPLNDTDVWLDKLIDFVEMLDLGVGGGYSRYEANFYVTALKRNSLTEADRLSLATWLNYNAIGDVQISELGDSNRTK